MRWMTRILAVLLLDLAFVAACGGSSSKSATTTPSPEGPQVADPIPTSAGPECSVVAEKLAIVVEAEKPDAQAGARELIQARCTQDKWSDEARSCFATVENDAEVDGCKAKLTDAQRVKMGDDAAPTADAAAAPKGAAPAPKPAVGSSGKKGSTRSADPEEGGE
jgi:hypothetical protein